MKKEGFLPLIGFHFPLLQGFAQFVKRVDDIGHLNFFRILIIQNRTIFLLFNYSLKKTVFVGVLLL